MNIENEFDLEHLLFKERTCRTCGERKNLIEDFYMTRKDRGAYPSAYSYECKQCTIKRVRKGKLPKSNWEYPDW